MKSFLVFSFVFALAGAERKMNDRPIIGIVTQETDLVGYVSPNVAKSYIAASYVKFVEGAGARPVPIWIGKSITYYERILGKINGVLLPGGAVSLDRTDGYAQAVRYIFKIAKEFNDRGDFFPIWGTCMGFELLINVAAGSIDILTSCADDDRMQPLDFTPDFLQSRLYSAASSDVIEILRNKRVTANFHEFCLTRSSFLAHKMDIEWRFMSVNHDDNGLEFISSIEHKTYPFYGVQFHPEKNLYEWSRQLNITHSADAVRASQFFADFLIGEARRSNFHFEDDEEEALSLIYNYPVTFMALKGGIFTQIYFFDASYEGIMG